jgi:hypothetical protein
MVLGDLRQKTCCTQTEVDLKTGALLGAIATTPIPDRIVFLT